MRFSVRVALLLVVLIGLSWALYESHLAYGVRAVDQTADSVMLGECCYFAAFLATAAVAILLSFHRRGVVVLQLVLLAAILATCGIVASGCFEEYYLRAAKVILPWQCGVCVKCSMFTLAGAFIGMMSLWVVVSHHK